MYSFEMLVTTLGYMTVRRAMIRMPHGPLRVGFLAQLDVVLTHALLFSPWTTRESLLMHWMTPKR
jgi:hypothetical protein